MSTKVENSSVFHPGLYTPLTKQIPSYLTASTVSEATDQNSIGNFWGRSPEMPEIANVSWKIFSLVFSYTDGHV